MCRPRRDKSRGKDGCGSVVVVRRVMVGQYSSHDNKPWSEVSGFFVLSSNTAMIHGGSPYPLKDSPWLACPSRVPAGAERARGIGIEKRGLGHRYVQLGDGVNVVLAQHMQDRAPIMIRALEVDPGSSRASTAGGFALLNCCTASQRHSPQVRQRREVEADAEEQAFGRGLWTVFVICLGIGVAVASSGLVLRS